MIARICLRCGYEGSPVWPTVMQCPRCCSVVSSPLVGRVDWWRLAFGAACACIVALITLVVCGLLAGCGGKEFTADDSDLLKDASAEDADALPARAGAGGAAVSEPGPAGAGGSAAGGAGAPSAAGAAAGTVGLGGSGGAAACAVNGWRASAFASYELDPAGGSADAALDGNAETRWASGETQSIGQWFELELPAGVVLEQLEVQAAPGDMPRGIELEIDGAPPSVTPIAISPGVLDLVLGQPTPARVVRLLITQPAPAPAWWSIRELRAVCR